MELEWMAWTTPTAVFFTVIALMLVSMTVWQALAPSAYTVSSSKTASSTL